MKGKLKIWPGLMGPMTSPPQEWGHKWAVTNVSYLEFKYYSDGKAVADLVPDIFELEERPYVAHWSVPRSYFLHCLQIQGENL